ncbi:MAG: hypothetical protein ACLR8P_22465 [Clostridium fessum]
MQIQIFQVSGGRWYDKHGKDSQIRAMVKTVSFLRKELTFLYHGKILLEKKSVTVTSNENSGNPHENEKVSAIK